MEQSIYFIPIPNLLLVITLVGIVAWVYWRWSLDVGTLFYATFRMLVQLAAIGFVLVYIFEAKRPELICLILIVMLTVSSWIALHPLKSKRPAHYLRALLAISLGSLPTLVLVVLGVLKLEPWYEPRYLIPIAGMIFANSMNCVSLAAERFHADIDKGSTYKEARAAAFRIALLPLLNAFFAVGIVSLPGMMTGQILSGISPLIAVRYQVMVMCMLLGASGISSAIYLTLLRPKS
jgi:putative ABC transport system permease protein